MSRDAPTTQICSPTAQNTQKPTPTKETTKGGRPKAASFVGVGFCVFCAVGLHICVVVLFLGVSGLGFCVLVWVCGFDFVFFVRLLAGKACSYFPKKHDLAKKWAVLAVSTGHILVLRCKTCALLRAKTSALLRRKTCAVLRARTCALLRANTKEAAFGRLHKGGRPSATPPLWFPLY